jgi:hypothetical protein
MNSILFDMHLNELNTYFRADVFEEVVLFALFSTFLICFLVIVSGLFT